MNSQRNAGPNLAMPGPRNGGLSKNTPPLTKGRIQVGLVFAGSLNKLKKQGRDYHNLPYIPSLVRRGAKFSMCHPEPISLS